MYIKRIHAYDYQKKKRLKRNSNMDDIERNASWNENK